MAQFGGNWEDRERATDAPPKESTPTQDSQRAADSAPTSVSADLIDPALRPQDKTQKPSSMHRHRLPSPPASISMPPTSHSPSPSVASSQQERPSSSLSTAGVRRSPPNIHAPPPPMFSSQYHHDIRQHHHQDPREIHHTYLYAPPPPPPQHFDQHRPPYQDHHHHYTASGIPPHFAAVPTMAHPAAYQHAPAPYPQPGQAPVTIIHTDDAATKLSDRVRRRCFNCCTTDTSTWRRSNLSPGKVLCNKCGLFERTHSRPRPEQFPHKRGPLATTSLQRRTPPAQQGQPGQSGPPPPHAAYPPPPPPGSAHLPPIGAPYQYSHPAIAPLNTDRRDQGPPQHGLPPPPNGLPTLQSWHPANGGSNGASGEGSNSAHGSPHLQNQQQQQRREGGSGHASPQVPSRLPTPPSSLSRSVNTSQESAARESEGGRDGRE